MAVSNTIASVRKALEDAQSKGAHSVRISTNILDALLGAHILVSAAFREIEERKSDGQD